MSSVTTAGTLHLWCSGSWLSSGADRLRDGRRQNNPGRGRGRGRGGHDGIRVVASTAPQTARLRRLRHGGWLHPWPLTKGRCNVCNPGASCDLGRVNGQALESVLRLGNLGLVFFRRLPSRSVRFELRPRAPGRDLGRSSAIGGDARRAGGRGRNLVEARWHEAGAGVLAEEVLAHLRSAPLLRPLLHPRAVLGRERWRNDNFITVQPPRARRGRRGGARRCRGCRWGRDARVPATHRRRREVRVPVPRRPFVGRQRRTQDGSRTRLGPRGRAARGRACGARRGGATRGRCRRRLDSPMRPRRRLRQRAGPAVSFCLENRRANVFFPKDDRCDGEESWDCRRRRGTGSDARGRRGGRAVAGHACAAGVRPREIQELIS